MDNAFRVDCDASPIDVQGQDQDRVISVPELGLAFETSIEMCGSTQQAADMRMHPLIVATCAWWAARAENMALWLELTVILIWVSHCLRATNNKLMTVVRNSIIFTEINGHAKWLQTCIGSYTEGLNGCLHYFPWDHFDVSFVDQSLQLVL